MATQTPSPTSRSKPSSPPPAYTELADSLHQPQCSTMNALDNGGAIVHHSAPLQAGYGPTPIPQQTHLLPYYDPRSPHAISEANRRARWRFVSALLWATGLMILASFLTGYEVHLRIHGLA